MMHRVNAGSGLRVMVRKRNVVGGNRACGGRIIGRLARIMGYER